MLKEEAMKTNYENAYINLFRFLYEDKKRSPLYYNHWYGVDRIIKYDGSHDFMTQDLVREFVEQAQKVGINPWQMLRFGAQIRDNDWVKNNPRVEFLPGEETSFFTFYIKYNWRPE